MPGRPSDLRPPAGLRAPTEPPDVGASGQDLRGLAAHQTGMNIVVCGVNYKASCSGHTDDGSKDAVSHIKSMADTCPEYPAACWADDSQGASVMDIVTQGFGVAHPQGHTMQDQSPTCSRAVVTFGNVADQQRCTDNDPRVRCSVSSAIDLLKQQRNRSCTEGTGNAWSGAHRGPTCPSTRPGGELRRRGSFGVQPHYSGAVADDRTVYGAESPTAVQ